MLAETRALLAKVRTGIAAAQGDELKAISTNLLDTVDEFLSACCKQRMVDETRDADLEITVRAPSAAVLAITESVSQAPAILALHDDADKAGEKAGPPAQDPVNSSRG